MEGEHDPTLSHFVLIYCCFQVHFDLLGLQKTRF